MLTRLFCKTLLYILLGICKASLWIFETVMAVMPQKTLREMEAQIHQRQRAF